MQSCHHIIAVTMVLFWVDGCRLSGRISHSTAHNVYQIYSNLGFHSTDSLTKSLKNMMTVMIITTCRLPIWLAFALIDRMGVYLSKFSVGTSYSYWRYGIVAIGQPSAWSERQSTTLLRVRTSAESSCGANVVIPMFTIVAYSCGEPSPFKLESRPPRTHHTPPHTNTTTMTMATMTMVCSCHPSSKLKIRKQQFFPGEKWT